MQKILFKALLILIFMLRIFSDNSHAKDLNIDDLSEIKSTYRRLYVEPHLEDEIIAGIDRIIKNKINKIVNLKIRGETYPPIEIYTVTHIDPHSYHCKLENGYADDSLHLLEFPEDHKPISYNESNVFFVNLDDNFRFVVEPHIYTGHNWEVNNVKDWRDNKFYLTSKLNNAVLFCIIEEKNTAKRKYKVLWLVDNDSQI